MSQLNRLKNVCSKIIVLNNNNFITLPTEIPNSSKKILMGLYKFANSKYIDLGINLRDHYQKIDDSCKINDTTIATVCGNYIRIFQVVNQHTIEKQIKFSTKCVAGENIKKIFLLSENSLVTISNNKIKIWDINPTIKGDREHIKEIEVSGKITTGCRINDTTIAVGVNTSGTKHDIFIYTSDGTTVRRLENHTNIINDICLINSNEIASGSEDGELNIWNITDGKLIITQTIGGPVASAGGGAGSSSSSVKRINTICHLFDDLIACGLDGEIIIYNKSNNTILGQLHVHSKKINDIEFIKSSGSIISVSEDGETKMTNINGSSSILEYLMSKGDYETAFLASCKYNNDAFITRLLGTLEDFQLRGGAAEAPAAPIEPKRELFIDCYDNEGLNGLMWMVKLKKIDQIRVMLRKGIYINAIDIDGNTALHHAVQIPDNLAIITLLCEHHEINVDILNDKLHTASHYIPKLPIDPYTGRSGIHPYETIIGSKTSSSAEDLKRKYYDSDWNGVTIKQLKVWFDNPLLLNDDADATGVNVFVNPLIKGICLGCFTPADRDTACNHVRCECRNNLKLSGFWNGRGGIIPWLNEEIIRQEFSIAEYCVACNTMCSDRGWPHELPQIAGQPPTQHESYICSSNPVKQMDTRPNDNRNKIWYIHSSKPRNAAQMFPDDQKLTLLRGMLGIKYYRIRKMIDKIIELQPRPGNAPIRFTDAMKQISDAGINIDAQDILTNHIPVFNAVIDEIMARKTFIPSDIDLGLFPHENIEDLYSLDPEDRNVLYPKLRHPRDVIENNLMPISVSDATEDDPVEFETSTDTIKFRHRNFRTLEIVEHNRVSYGNVLGAVITHTINPDDNYKSKNNFGKCIMNSFDIAEDVYLYPDEFKIFFQRGYTKGDRYKINNAEYIAYRTNFIASDKIKYYIPRSDVPKIRKMFIMDESSYEFLPESACGAGAAAGAPNVGGAGLEAAQGGGYYNKYQKYLQKYLFN
jgi:hypothetical protein